MVEFSTVLLHSKYAIKLGCKPLPAFFRANLDRTHQVWPAAWCGLHYVRHHLRMPNIYRTVANYQGPFAALNTSPNESFLRCRKLDLYRSIITVGNPSFFSWQSIRELGLARALYESILEKVALVAVNIESDRNGMRRHKIFDTYVSDKKRIVSYNLGMTFAKFYSEKLIGIPNLVHVEFLKKSNAISFAPNPGGIRTKEPDLVGQTADGNWHVVEAKGVSYSESQLTGKITEAKLQIQQVATIYGSPPTTGNACATYIGTDRIFTRLEDPPTSDGKHLELKIEKFHEAYYSPFLLARELLQVPHRKERVDGIDIEFIELERANRKLRIGLESEIAELALSKNFNLLTKTRQKLQSFSIEDSQNERYSIGLDGFAVSYSEH